MKADYILLQDRLKGEYKDAFQKVQMYSTSNLIGAGGRQTGFDDCRR